MATKGGRDTPVRPSMEARGKVPFQIMKVKRIFLWGKSLMLLSPWPPEPLSLLRSSRSATDPLSVGHKG